MLSLSVSTPGKLKRFDHTGQALANQRWRVRVPPRSSERFSLPGVNTLRDNITQTYEQFSWKGCPFPRWNVSYGKLSRFSPQWTQGLIILCARILKIYILRHQRNLPPQLHELMSVNHIFCTRKEKNTSSILKWKQYTMIYVIVTICKYTIEWINSLPEWCHWLPLIQHISFHLKHLDEPAKGKKRNCRWKCRVEFLYIC
jgi:hypothetical protein